jgi:hypothetical protein
MNGQFQSGFACLKGANNGSSLLTHRLVGERNKLRRVVRLSAVLWGPSRARRSLVRGFQRFTSQKNLFRAKGWSKLALSFRCAGLVREWLDQQRTAYGAAAVAVAKPFG